MKTKTHIYLYTNVQAALFITGKREKQARWPPTHEWIKVTCPYNGLRGMEGSKCGHMLQHGWNWKASCWIKVARQTRPHEHTCMQNPKQQVYRERTSLCSCWSWGSLEEYGKWILIEVCFFFSPLATLVVKMVAQLCKHVKISGHSEYVKKAHRT